MCAEAAFFTECYTVIYKMAPWGITISNLQSCPSDPAKDRETCDIKTHMRRDPGNLLTRSSATPCTFRITSSAELTKPKQRDTKTVFPLEQ
ncbi:hypothetical protein Q8A67_022508 [Cirrhinus molitorella]|uniref:Uncharacterized protein n=1 Tax=Cirrhinus molitorella TaxID=172907 RepID=A0AA88TB51_9TELE|nr:hypothetical protein Q8A67_022508 [Cirrhinus molitorella]